MIRISPALRLLTSAAVIFGVLAGVAGVSSALFTSAPASATDISFTTGSASLSISADSSGPTGYGSSLSVPDITGLTPGETSTFTFWLKNESSDAMELDLSADLANITANGDLGSNLNISFECLQGGTTSGNGDGATTIKNLTTWGTDVAERLDEGADTTPGRLGPNAGAPTGGGADEAKCTMTATLDPSSISQATAASFDAQFTGTQVSGT